MSNEIPLIYTIEGNIPCDDVEEKTEWIVNDDFIHLKLKYYRKDNGKLVKESGHVYSKHGFLGKGLIGN